MFASGCREHKSSKPSICCFSFVQQSKLRHLKSIFSNIWDICHHLIMHIIAYTHSFKFKTCPLYVEDGIEICKSLDINHILLHFVHDASQPHKAYNSHLVFGMLRALSMVYHNLYGIWCSFSLLHNFLSAYAFGLLKALSMVYH